MGSIVQRFRLLGAAGLATILALLATPALARDSDWRFCANEGDECRVQGTATVRYGAPGQWETRRITNRVRCSNKHFGDPAPNREKRCEVLDTNAGGGGGWGGSGSSGWNDCAEEGEVCYFSGRAQVRFGDGRRFNTRTARDSIRCDVKTFGDPAYGKVKRCQVQGTSTGGGWGGSGGSNRPQDDDEKQWAHCANEGGTCNVGKRTRVRFGANGRYLQRDVDQSIECSIEAFGRDPAPNQVKTCSWHY
jgi:hypothetical protein